jgi:hypothetical protein
MTLTRRYIFLQAVGSAGLAALLPLVAGALAPAGAVPPRARAKRPAVPFDDAKRDAALVQVRAAMLRAAKARDAKALLAHTTPGIKLDFGGGKGQAELAKRLVRDKHLWDELVWVLENGGKMIDKASFAAPYAFEVDIGDLDPFTAGIVVDAQVPARSAPGADAALVATLGHEVVEVMKWQSGGEGREKVPFYRRTGWLEIRTHDKKKAFVEARHVRSAVDYRARFVKKGGAWKMDVFIDGD